MRRLIQILNPSNLNRTLHALLTKLTCKHERLMETNYHRPFTLGQITGYTPVYLCAACGKQLSRIIHA